MEEQKDKEALAVVLSRIKEYMLKHKSQAQIFIPNHPDNIQSLDSIKLKPTSPLSKPKMQSSASSGIISSPNGVPRPTKSISSADVFKISTKPKAATMVVRKSQSYTNAASLFDENKRNKKGDRF